ncbi:hypothetical protein N0V90_009218 [Kalmusia sp. IMI 367209]|nr:hypothetical protein N0V90_009218 [Kalmusia sp. IMI 367209]
MPAGQIVVPLKPGSDGDYMHRPPESSTYTPLDPPTLYLERIGLQWMQDRGEALPGVKYILERLPTGYALYQRPRKNGLKDKYLFGHPDHKPFDSPNRYYPHFKHLMENNGDRMGCPCTVCDPRGGVLPGKTGLTSGFFNSSNSKGGSSGASSIRESGVSSRKANGGSSKKPSYPVRPNSPPSTMAEVPTRYQPKGRPKMALVGVDSSRIDEEGTPDVYRNLVDKLKRNGTVDEAIEEPMSLDWRAEQKIIPSLLEKLQRDPQWKPRAGDIVLYIRNMSKGLEIIQDPPTGIYRFFDARKDEFLGRIEWGAGLVGQPPAENLEGTLGEDEWDVSYAGVRVEPLPNPNDDNKSLSKRHKYVPLSSIRPLFLWNEYLGRIPEDEWHPTIHNAFTVSATMSLVGKHHFRGAWPKAQIFCHAIYIGAELVAVGDTVRLLPKADQEGCVDVLVVKTIRLMFSNLDQASTNDYDEGRPYNSEVWIFGSAYTTEASRSSKEWLNEHNTDVPKSAAGYGNWYPLHPSNKELAIPFSRVIGRLYEQDVMQSWFPDLTVDLDSGREGVCEARRYATNNDQRIITSFGASWFWADNRAEALDLHTINGLEVGRFNTERDPREWRKKIKKMMGADVGAESSGQKPVLGVRSLRGFMAPTATRSLPMRTQEPPSEGSSTAGSSTAGSSTAGNSATIGSKRNVINVSDDEEEIRRQTLIVKDVPPSAKKARVMVVVD